MRGNTISSRFCGRPAPGPTELRFGTDRGEGAAPTTPADLAPIAATQSRHGFVGGPPPGRRNFDLAPIAARAPLPQPAAPTTPPPLPHTQRAPPPPPPPHPVPS